MGLNIDLILKQKGLNRSKLSEMLGKSNRSYVTNALKNPTLKTLEEIAEVLEVDVRELFQPKDGGGLLNGFIQFKDKIYSINNKKDLTSLLSLIEKG